MNPRSARRISVRPLSLLAVAAGSALVAVVGTLATLHFTGLLSPRTSSRQEMVHAMGISVMPFDLERTTHIFQMTETGGVQQVVAKDPNDSRQISLIQQHLQHEAGRFGSGDFSDPTSLHGGDMPGVKDLSADASRIKVEYAPLPNGGQITFATDDWRLATAIHRWFGAQLSDHGRDATYR
jgi:hypothetical protein